MPQPAIPDKFEQFRLENGFKYDRNMSGGDHWILTLPNIHFSENVFNCKSSEIDTTMGSQVCDIVDLDSMEDVRSAVAVFFVAAYHEDGSIQGRMRR